MVTMKERPEFYREILRLLGEGNYPAKVARALGFSPRKVYYWINEALKEGLIRPRRRTYVSGRKSGRSYPTFYDLTEAGRDYVYVNLTRSDRPHRTVRLHNLVVKYPILGPEKKKVDWRRVSMENWERLIGSFCGLKVEKTTKHVIVYADTIYGSDPHRLLLYGKEMCDRVADWLRHHTGIVLGSGRLSRKPHWAVYDKVAERVAEDYEFSSEAAKIDKSEGYGEIDFLDPDSAKDYLLLPNRVKHLLEENVVLRRDLEEVKKIIADFGKHLETHTKVMKRNERVLKRIEEFLDLVLGYGRRPGRGKPSYIG